MALDMKSKTAVIIMVTALVASAQQQPTTTTTVDQATYDAAVARLKAKQQDAQGAAETPATKPSASKLRADAPDAGKALWARREELSKAEHARLLEWRKNVTAALAGANKNTPPSALKSWRAQLVQIQDQLAKMKTVPIFLPKGDNAADFKVGFIGTIPKTMVKRVMDDKNVVLTLETITMPIVGRYTRPDGADGGVERALVPVETDVWLSGVDTKGLTDKTEFTSVKAIYMNATTADAGTTTLKAVPFDIADYLEKAK
jgi:hypothetical protein